MSFDEAKRDVFTSNFAEHLMSAEQLVCYVPATEGPPEKWMQFITSFKAWSVLYGSRLVGATNHRLIILSIGRSWKVRGKAVSAPLHDVAAYARRSSGWTYLEVTIRSGGTRRFYVAPDWVTEADELLGLLHAIDAS